MEVKYLVTGLVLSIFFLAVAGLVNATHFSICSPVCNTTVVWWNDTVNVTGNGSVSAAVTARINGIAACSTTASSSGNWNCTFLAPQNAGSYNLSVTVGSVTDESILTVRPNYGEQTATISVSKFVLETPLAIQEPSGKVNNLLARLIVFRGPIPT